MNILHDQKGDQHIYYIEQDNERVAEMYYRLRDNSRMIIEHTDVSDKLQGKGVGKQLVDHAVAFARENNLKIIPLCPFTRSVFERFKGYEDVQ